MSTEPEEHEEAHDPTPAEPEPDPIAEEPEAHAHKRRGRRAKREHAAAEAVEPVATPDLPAANPEADEAEEATIVDGAISEEASVLLVETLMGSADDAVVAQPLAPTVLEFLHQAVQAVGSRDRKGRITPALWRQIGKAANTVCDALEIADVAPKLLDVHASTLLRLAVLMGMDPGKEKAAQKALAAMIRRERKALASGLEG
ncbi:MAG TPA: hypothetical protein VGM37_15275 [Armatimonadota bacterium]